jgi:hypothetical protein
MKLTNGVLEKYVGGQMEIQNRGESYIFRGEIKTIAIDATEQELVVKFNWLAKGDGFPPIPNKWVNQGRLDYAAGVELFSSCSDIGNDRLCFGSQIIGELVVLYPPGGSVLDPAKVEGLILT